MQIFRSTNGDLAGFIDIKVGMTVTVDAHKTDDDDLNEWMEDNNDGVGMLVDNWDNESNLVWVKNCPYAIPSEVVWRDE